LLKKSKNVAKEKKNITFTKYQSINHSSLDNVAFMLELSQFWFSTKSTRSSRMKQKDLDLFFLMSGQ